MQQQRIIQDITDDEYNKYSVIKPPDEFFGDYEKYTRVVIDSRIRDQNLYPNANNYEIPFDDDINDVITAELIYIDIPFTVYLINQYFNKLFINYNGSDYIITIDTGDYDYSTLQVQIQNKLDTILGTNAIIIAYNPKLDSYTFTSTHPFTFNFQNQINTIGTIIGFKINKNYIASGTGPYTLNSEFRRNFEYNNYIIMDIDQFDLLKSIDRDLNKTFAVIPKNYDVLSLSDNPKYIKKFSPPIGRMTKIRIHLYDRFGNEYDCQNKDHRFELLLKSHKQRRKYGNIFSN